MSLVHALWDSTGSTETAITLVLRLSNSGFSRATDPSSVGHASDDESGAHLVVQPGRDRGREVDAEPEVAVRHRLAHVAPVNPRGHRPGSRNQSGRLTPLPGR